MSDRRRAAPKADPTNAERQARKRYRFRNEITGTGLIDWNDTALDWIVDICRADPDRIDEADYVAQVFSSMIAEAAAEYFASKNQKK